MKPELLHSACHQGRATSLTLAIKSGHLPVVEFLWSRGAEQHLRDKASCLTAAISSGEELICILKIRLLSLFSTRNKNDFMTPFTRTEKVGFCYVIPVACPKTSAPFLETRIRLGHPLRYNKKFSLFQYHKVLDASEKGDEFVASVTLWWVETTWAMISSLAEHCWGIRDFCQPSQRSDFRLYRLLFMSLAWVR